MNLSGNPEHREAYVLSVEPAGPAPGTVSPAGARGRRAAGRGPRNPRTIPGRAPKIRPDRAYRAADEIRP